MSKYPRMKRAIIFLINYIIRLLPLGYMGLIWFLSSYPSDAIVNTGWTYERSLKEGLHLLEFGILYLLLVLALLSWGRLNQKSSFLAALFSVLYGLTDELHQYFVPSRSCSVIDFAKDIIGVAVAWYIIRRAYTVPESKVKKLLTWIENKL